ncbi:peptidoglycan endopeptidase [Sphingomonas sp. IC-11]|uniref:peptidoglycan endopeptidase n=1 Tax=Sphingomonas sp. IC-11 TaxID=2898528 RepID=UPI001E355137|nr:peptidoglycan endopeptidase [Sphingomonas sp. IC-11]MCD2317649.1 peptidoglycan endopeptidase [Sphingomonas sp. IC-11]
MTAGERVAAAARGVVGAPFRLQGREPATGLDCVGVVALALQAGGHEGPVPSGYGLRCGDAARYRSCWAGLAGADGRRAGDVLLCLAGPRQLHLAIRTATGFVHADAGLRRVVERPGQLPWPLVMAWRLGES